MTDHAIENRIAELESKLAFQEITISDLNQELVTQQSRVERMQQQLKALFQQIESMKDSNIARPEDETPPPHY